MKTPRILFLTGASGAGKTSLLKQLASEMGHLEIAYLHFDSIGVPTETEMIEQYGSPRAWQKAMTRLWAHKILSDYRDKEWVLIEGQVDIQFIKEAFAQLSDRHCKIILIHCEKTVREKRLCENRNQPHLANKTMENWAQYLKKQAEELGVRIIDTTGRHLRDAAQEIIVEMTR